MLRWIRRLFRRPVRKRTHFTSLVPEEAGLYFAITYSREVEGHAEWIVYASPLRHMYPREPHASGIAPTEFLAQLDAEDAIADLVRLNPHLRD